MMLKQVLVVLGLLMFPASSKAKPDTFTGTYELTKVTDRQTGQQVPLPDQYLMTIEACPEEVDASYCLYLKIVNLFRASTRSSQQAGSGSSTLTPVDYIGETRMWVSDPKVRAVEIQVHKIFDATKPLPKVIMTNHHEKLIIRSTVGRMVFQRKRSS